jgi:hypothetical protein
MALEPFRYTEGTYQSHSSALDAERLVNFYLERSPQGAKSMIPLFGAAGIRSFANVGPGPMLGFHVMNDVLYAVSGQGLYSIAPGGVATLLGTVKVGGIVSIADNGTQMVLVDGQTGWIYQIGGLNQYLANPVGPGINLIQLVNITGTISPGDPINLTLDNGQIFSTVVTGVIGINVFLQTPVPAYISAGARVVDTVNVVGQITHPSFQPSGSVIYFDNYFIFNAARTAGFFLSALGDGTTYNATDRATAESSSNYVLAVVNFHEQLMVFKEKSIEFWYDSGNASFPFSRTDGAFVQRGMIGPNALCQEDNTVLWIGEDKIFYRLDGIQPTRLSTHGVETAWQNYQTINDAFCLVFTQEGHKMVAITFPSAQATWVFDLASREWHERESWDYLNRSLGRWRVNCVIAAYDQIIVGDCVDGKIGTLDFNTFTEFGNTMRGMIVSAPLHQGRSRLFMDWFEIDVDAGVGTTTGQGADPQIMLDWSDDGGHSWSQLQRWRSLGRKGANRQRVRWGRLGSFRQRSLRLQITDPVRRNIVGCYTDAEAED